MKAMPSERRTIRFNLDEVTAAVRLGLPRLGLDVPGGRVAAIEGRDTGFRFDLVTDDGSAGTGLTLSAAQTAVCVLLFCRAYDVPIGKRHTKRLDVEDGALVLHLAHAFDVDATATAARAP
jgi:hypothetical protein